MLQEDRKSRKSRLGSTFCFRLAAAVACLKRSTQHFSISCWVFVDRLRTCSFFECFSSHPPDLILLVSPVIFLHWSAEVKNATLVKVQSSKSSSYLSQGVPTAKSDKNSRVWTSIDWACSLIDDLTPTLLHFACLRIELEEESPVINWSLELGTRLDSRLYALWNRTAGDCLLDSVLQATWGIYDKDSVLRKTLHDSLHDCSHWWDSQTYVTYGRLNPGNIFITWNSVASSDCTVLYCSQ